MLTLEVFFINKFIEKPFQPIYPSQAGIISNFVLFIKKKKVVYRLIPHSERKTNSASFMVISYLNEVNEVWRLMLQFVQK